MQRMLVNALPRNAITLLFVIIFCAGCGAGGGSDVSSSRELRTINIDTSDELFEPQRLLQVDIQMDPAEFDTLRREGRHLPDVFSGCAAGFEYSHFKATVSVDGEPLADVDIRKKGFLGSLSASRPSFKLNFDTHLPEQRLQSLKRMTLNNNRQDPSNTHQCISYQMFRDVGLPAPRCNFARVTMNGADLGIYSHVESIKEHFLRRNFADDLGNLYEAQFGDFGV
jgi:spore coat protein H